MKAATHVLGVCAIFLMLLICAQVFMRYVVKSPLAWSEELCRLVIVFTMVTGTWLGVVGKSHTRIDCLRHIFGGRLKPVGDILEFVTVCGFCALMAYGSVLYAKNSMRMSASSAVLQVPLWPFVGLFAVVGVLCIIQYIVNYIEDFKATHKRKGDGTNE